MGPNRVGLLNCLTEGTDRMELFNRGIVEVFNREHQTVPGTKSMLVSRVNSGLTPMVYRGKDLTKPTSHTESEGYTLGFSCRLVRCFATPKFRSRLTLKERNNQGPKPRAVRVGWIPATAGSDSTRMTGWRRASSPLSHH